MNATPAGSRGMSQSAEAGPLGTVLVVEDEEGIRLLIDDVLQELGFTVLVATDGAGAMEHLRGTVPIDLLITDIGLPGGMNGRQVADAARAINPGLPVLIMTGFAGADIADHARLQRGVSVLTKPFTMAALTGRIQQLLGQPPAR